MSDHDAWSDLERAFFDAGDALQPGADGAQDAPQASWRREPASSDRAARLRAIGRRAVWQCAHQLDRGRLALRPRFVRACQWMLSGWQTGRVLRALHRVRDDRRVRALASRMGGQVAQAMRTIARWAGEHAPWLLRRPWGAVAGLGILASLSVVMWAASGAPKAARGAETGSAADAPAVTASALTEADKRKQPKGRAVKRARGSAAKRPHR